MGSRPQTTVFVGIKCDRCQGEELIERYPWLEEFSSSEEYSGVGISVLETDWNDSPLCLDLEDFSHQIEEASEKFTEEFTEEFGEPSVYINCDFR